MHVDEFIDNPTTDAYASLFLDLHRLPAIDQFTESMPALMSRYKLFCKWSGDGKTYRVTGCSSMGDVWFTSDYEQDTGYQKRVNVVECSDWSDNTKETDS